MSFLRSISSWLLGGSQRSAELTLNDVQLELLKSMTTMITTGLGIETALAIPAVSKGVKLIANDVGRCRKSSANPDVERLLRFPSFNVSGFDFFRSVTLRAVASGNGYAQIVRDSLGVASGLVPIDVTSIEWNADRTDYGYATTLGRRSKWDILHIKAPGTDGIVGLSSLRSSSASTTLARQVTELAVEVFSNGGQSKIAAVGPGPYNQETTQLILNAYQQHHTGPGSGRRPLVLWDNMRVDKIGATLNDAMWREVADFTVQDVARCIDVPAVLLGDTSPSPYKSFEELARAYVWMGLSPWLEAWSAEFELKLGGRIDFDTTRLTLPSFAETMAGCRTAIECRLMNPNECRALMDMQPYEGGDTFSQALNLGTGGGSTNAGNDTSLGATGS